MVYDFLSKFVFYVLEFSWFMVYEMSHPWCIRIIEYWLIAKIKSNHLQPNYIIQLLFSIYKPSIHIFMELHQKKTW